MHPATDAENTRHDAATRVLPDTLTLHIDQHTLDQLHGLDRHDMSEDAQNTRTAIIHEFGRSADAVQEARGRGRAVPDTAAYEVTRKRAEDLALSYNMSEAVPGMRFDAQADAEAAALGEVMDERGLAEDVKLYREDPERYADKRATARDAGEPEAFPIAAARALSGESPDALDELLEDRKGEPITRDEMGAMTHAMNSAGVSAEDSERYRALMPPEGVQDYRTEAERKRQAEHLVGDIMGQVRRGELDTGAATEKLVDTIAAEPGMQQDREIIADFIGDKVAGSLPSDRFPNQDASSLVGTTEYLLRDEAPTVTAPGDTESNPVTTRTNPDGSPRIPGDDRAAEYSTGLSFAEREPGWGTVKANRSALYRRDPESGVWQQRPRHGGADAKWTPVPAPAPSAKLIAPSVAAADMGGVCVACGREINDGTSRGGYGPECAKKYT